MRRRPRLVYITTVPATAYLFLRGQLAFMDRAGFDVHVVSSPGAELDAAASREGVTAHGIPIPREVDTRADLVALVRLVRLFRRLKPDIVNASTPKAGLLGMLAARITRVPVRIYLLRGLKLETAQGPLLRILAKTEQLAAACSHQVVCVSASLRTAYVAGGYGPAIKCTVLGKGSSNGVDLERHARTPQVRRAAAELSEQIGLPAEAEVIGFAGRLVEDKGILPLLDAFDLIHAERPQTHLVLVGDSLAGDTVSPEIRARVSQSPNVHVLPHMDGLAPFYGMLDVVAFPSYREGFPNVPLEASAAGLPVVGFPSTGVVDAIEHGVTGQIVPQSAEALASGLLSYLRDPALGEAHGAAGLARVERDFRPIHVWRAWQAEYVRHLRARGLPFPMER